MSVSMLHTFADHLRQNFGRSLARLAARPEYPVNDFADDPTMQAQQSFLTVRVTPDDALRTGSGFVGAVNVPLSRILPLIPKSDTDMVADVLDLGKSNARVRNATETPQGYEFHSGSLDISVPSYNHCAENLARAARKYSRDLSSACCRASNDLRSSIVTIRGSYLYCDVRKNTQDIHELYEFAKSLRASTEATREFVREYDRASDMLTVHRYLAARKAGDQAAMDALRNNSAVSLFLRCGDLDA